MTFHVSPQRIAVAVVEQGGYYLIGKRPPHVPLGGLWEFPGGKLLPGETVFEGAVRECLEETGIAPRAEKILHEVEHAYEHGTLRIAFVACSLGLASDALPKPQGPFCWVHGTKLPEYPFPPANESLLKLLAR